jgi:hypothetical protein
MPLLNPSERKQSLKYYTFVWFTWNMNTVHSSRVSYMYLSLQIHIGYRQTCRMWIICCGTAFTVGHLFLCFKISVWLLRFYISYISMQHILAENILKLLEIIGFKHRYNSTSFITDTARWVEIPSYTLCRLSAEIAVNKQWTLWTHLILYTWKVTKLLFNIGIAKMTKTPSSDFFKMLLECKSTYQVHIAWENKKFVTYNWWLVLFKYGLFNWYILFV